MIVFPSIGRHFIPSIEEQFDLLHFAATTTASRYRPRVPSVVTVHGLFSRWSEQFRRYLPLLYKMIFNPAVSESFKILEARCFANVDAVIALSQLAKSYIVEQMRIPSEKVFVVPNGVDPDTFVPPASGHQREDLVLFVGRGSITKGLDLLLMAARHIKGKILAVTPLLSRANQKLGARLTNIKIIPRLDRRELSAIYQRGRVFVLPSIAENSPLVTLEAMACGLPVVVTKEGAADYVRNGVEGFIIPFRDADALAERVNYLLEHPSEAEKMGSAGRQRVLDHFTFNQHAAAVLKIYRQLAPNRFPEAALKF
jgi:glycosyltransferase involved in cell wall biosynthesis